MKPPPEHRSESAPHSRGALSLTVKRGYTVAWGDEVFRPGDRIEQGHPCVPTNRARLVAVVSEPKSRRKPRPADPSPPAKTEEGEESGGE